MKNTLLKIIMSISILLPAAPVSALKPEFISDEVKPSGTSVTIPANARQVAPHVFSLGTTFDNAAGKVVEGYAFVTPKEGFGHKPNHGGGRGKPDNGGSTTSSCYAYTAKGAYWKNEETWLVNPSNTVSLGQSFVVNEMIAGVDQWEDAADGTLDGAAVDIFGSGSPTTTPLVADMVSTDNQNEVLFGSIDAQGAIAVTIVWGIFSGPPRARELVEWDIVFDQKDFKWSEDATGDATSMDFINIAVHEIGHAFGMTHPEDSCVDETMYRFATEGETAKRNLNDGDISGINKLY